MAEDVETAETVGGGAGEDSGGAGWDGDWVLGHQDGRAHGIEERLGELGDLATAADEETAFEVGRGLDWADSERGSERASGTVGVGDGDLVVTGGE
jgi:hypothetical protein